MSVRVVGSSGTCRSSGRGGAVVVRPGDPPALLVVVPRRMPELRRFRTRRTAGEEQGVKLPGRCHEENVTEEESDDDEEEDDPRDKRRRTVAAAVSLFNNTSRAVVVMVVVVGATRSPHCTATCPAPDKSGAKERRRWGDYFRDWENTQTCTLRPSSVVGLTSCTSIVLRCGQ